MTGPERVLATPSGPTDTDIEVGWRGRISASLIGGFLVGVATGLVVTLWVPGYDGLDQALQGGLAATLAMPIGMIWILFARTGKRAWKRALISLVSLLLLAAAGYIFLKP
ncbi:MAG: hypothetical protein AAGA81_22610 [Acidobacteriota bacterium]